jgi:hypothetical protein
LTATIDAVVAVVAGDDADRNADVVGASSNGYEKAMCCDSWCYGFLEKEVFPWSTLAPLT